MNRTVQNGIMGVIGVIVLTASLNGLYLNFVKGWLQTPLIISAVLLIAVAVYGTYAEDWRRSPGRRRRGSEDTAAAAAVGVDGDGSVDEGGHGHEGGDHHHLRVGWLLLAPFLVLGVAAPPPLGAYSASTSGSLTSTIESAEGLPALSAIGVVDTSLSEYSARALYEDPSTMEGRTFRLTGFVTPADTPEGWVLGRMALNCCAADAYAVRVETRGGQRFPDNTWVTVEGTFVATPERVSADKPPGLPVLQVTSIKQVPQPREPYDA